MKRVICLCLSLLISLLSFCGCVSNMPQETLPPDTSYITENAGVTDENTLAATPDTEEAETTVSVTDAETEPPKTSAVVTTAGATEETAEPPADTTSPVTTAPETTAPVTIAPVTIAPVTTAPVTTVTVPATTEPITEPPKEPETDILQRSYVENADGTCIDRESGTVFFTDDLNNEKLMHIKGNGVTFDKASSSELAGDRSLVRSKGGGEEWFVYKLDSGIKEAFVSVFFRIKASSDILPKIYASQDGESYTEAAVILEDRVLLANDATRCSIVARELPEGTKYLKIDLGVEGLEHSKVAISRVRINNIDSMKQNEIEKKLELRESRTYYVDSVKGKATYDGLTPETPKRSFNELKNIFFQAGDKILLKKSCEFNGVLTITGCGTEEEPIYVGSYGEGTMPIVNGNGRNAAVQISAQHIVVDGIEVTNANGSFGIYILPLTEGENEDITIRNCYVHDVDVEENNFNYITCGGILARADGSTPVWFKDLNIEGNRIENVCRCAVVISNSWGWRYHHEANWLKNNYVSDDEGWYPNVECKIRNNYINGARGDAILIQCGKDMLIEHNTVYNSCCSKEEHGKTAMVAVWTISTLNTVMQYNEVAYTKRNAADGEAFDTDHSDVNCTIQYNYSHDNEGGFVLLCNTYEGTAKNAVVRYNLSVNDGKKNGIVTFIGSVPGSQIYNNTFFVSATDVLFFMWGNDGKPIKAQDVTLTNNLFIGSYNRGIYYADGSIGKDFYQAVENIVFDTNLFSKVLMPSSRGGVLSVNNKKETFSVSCPKNTEDKEAVMKAFTPMEKYSGAKAAENSPETDINGTKVTAPHFGCIAY